MPIYDLARTTLNAVPGCRHWKIGSRYTVLQGNRQKETE